MVERPEEHGISCPVVTRDCAGIPHLKVSRYSLVHCGSLFSLLDMQRNRINQINRHEPNHYPDELWMYVAMLIRKRVATLSITHKFLVYFRKFC